MVLAKEFSGRYRFVIGGLQLTNQMRPAQAFRLILSRP